jgi:hypothetical protein
MAMKGDEDENSPFMNKIKEVFETQVTAQEYIPIMLDRELVKSLEPEEVFIVDFSKYCPTMEIKYYKTMVTDIPLNNC